VMLEVKEERKGHKEGVYVLPFWSYALAYNIRWVE